MPLLTGQTLPTAQARAPENNIFRDILIRMFPAKFWIFSTLFALGVIVGLSYLLIHSPESGMRAPVSPDRNPEMPATTESMRANNIDPLVGSNRNGNHESPASLDLSTQVDGYDFQRYTSVDLRDEGDKYLIAGNTGSAAQHYQQSQKISGRITSDISVRLGICAELDGKPGAAARHFQRVLELEAPLNHRLLALTGLSRTWIERGNRREALNILCDLFLQSLSQPMPLEIEAQINHQLGTALQDIAFRNYHYDLNQADGIAFYNAPPEIPVMLSLLNKSSPDLSPVAYNQQDSMIQTSSGRSRATPARPTPRLAINVLQRPNNSIDLMIVDVDAPLQPVSHITKHLATSCELELFASEQAKAVIAGRSKSLVAKNVQASLLLDHLLIPLDLFWFQDERGIHLLSLHEDSIEPYADKFWPTAMERVLRRFNVAFPGDHRGRSSLLSRGNLKFVEGNLDRASGHYQELLKLNPRDELLARLFFNIGKIDMRLGRNEDAIRHFYHAVDQSYDSRFQSSGYWLVAQLSLETHRLDDAITAAGRALSLAHTDLQRRQSALTMARAYLLSNKPFSANQVLFENRKAFSGTDLAPTATVLASYARFVGTTDEIHLESERHRLLTAVAMTRDDDFQNFLDVYIASRALQGLGFQEDAIEKLKLAIEGTTIQKWRSRFLFELGVQLAIAGQRREAVEVFKFLTTDESGNWRNRSSMQLAEIYLELGELHECITVCQQLLSQKPDDNTRSKTLDTMGRAYRKLGENHTAALCFAGLIPDSKFPVSTPEPN